MEITTLRVSLPPYFFTLWTVAQRQFLQINTLLKYFLDAKMLIWRLHRSLMIICIPSESEGLALVTTLIHIFAVIWSLSYITFVEILRNLWNYYVFFLFTDSVVSLFLSPPHCASWRWGCRNGLRTRRLAASILTLRSLN